LTRFASVRERLDSFQAIIREQKPSHSKLDAPDISCVAFV
jgi:hypothetical protein